MALYMAAKGFAFNRTNNRRQNPGVSARIAALLGNS
jgi:hypothetical protein